MKFGTIFKYTYGIQANAVFLGETRKGEMIFGTEGGGFMRFDADKYQEAIESGLLVKEGGEK